MSEYRDVLHKWAKQYLEEDAKVIDVKFIHEEGFHYSSLTFQDPYDEIVIEYEMPDGTNQYWNSNYRCSTYSLSREEFPPFGELLQQLFEIAEREQND